MASSHHSHIAPQMGQVRVRFAPSPTGYLHVGGARTAFYNYLFARKYQGKFILRIEDTDEARSTDESLKMVMEDLQWLGMNWDEGPDPVTLKDRGEHGPYRQSQRMDLYKKHADELLQSGKAYYCFLTDAEIEKQRETLMSEGKSLHIHSPYADWTIEQALQKIKEGGKPVVRFRTQHLKKDYRFVDLVRGEVTFPSDMVGDFVLLRNGGMPVYNFCNVVDDYGMKITHVLRAEEHLSNTLRQLMLYEAFGWQIPQFGHVSLILDEDRKKLSKRKGATSCHEFKGEGYLPSALNNFLVLLGWSHPEEKEVLTIEELIQSFSTERLQPSGAVFDAVKLKWMNAQHLRRMPNEELWKLIEPFLGEIAKDLPKDTAWRSQSLEVFKPAMETLQDAKNLYTPLADSLFQIFPEAAETLGWESSKKVCDTWLGELHAFDGNFLAEADFLRIEGAVKEKAAVKGKFLFMPVRVAVIGKPHGSELKILVPLIPKQSLIARVEKVLKHWGPA